MWVALNSGWNCTPQTRSRQRKAWQASCVERASTVAPSGARSTVCRCVAWAGNARGRPANSGSSLGVRVQLDVDRAHLAPGRVVADLAAERVRQQLVAVADAEQRHAGVRGIAQPVGAAFAPVGRSVTIAAEPVTMHAGEALARAAALRRARHSTTTASSACRPAATRIQCGKAAVAAHEATGWPVSRIRKGASWRGRSTVGKAVQARPSAARAPILARFSPPDRAPCTHDR